MLQNLYSSWLLSKQNALISQTFREYVHCYGTLEQIKLFKSLKLATERNNQMRLSQC